MSDRESFEENENIIMNLNGTGDKGENNSKGNNFFHIQLDLADTKSIPVLIQQPSVILPKRDVQTMKNT
jgi:predicted metal-dependent TIM-barrel fold hydrolase